MSQLLRPSLGHGPRRAAPPSASPWRHLDASANMCAGDEERVETAPVARLLRLCITGEAATVRGSIADTASRCYRTAVLTKKNAIGDGGLSSETVPVGGSPPKQGPVDVARQMQLGTLALESSCVLN